MERGGVPSNYSAEMWEYLHKTVMKKPWQGSNKRKVDRQIMCHNNVREFLFGVNSNWETKKTRSSRYTNWDEVSLLFDNLA